MIQHVLCPGCSTPIFWIELLHEKHSHLLCMFSYPAVAGYHAVSAMLLLLLLSLLFQEVVYYYDVNNGSAFMVQRNFNSNSSDEFEFVSK